MSGATGPLLVLMPGLDGTGRLFEPLIAALPAGWEVRVVRYPAERPTTLADHAAIAREVIGRDRVILIAESFSGLVALQLLREGGIDVEKIVFVASFASPPRILLRATSALLPTMSRATRFLPDRLWRLFCLGPRASGKEIGWLRGTVASVAPSVIGRRLKLLATTEFRFPSPIEIPAFYLEASGDRLVPASAAERMAPLFRSFTKVEIEGPHFLLQARAEACAGILREICQS